MGDNMYKASGTEPLRSPSKTKRAATPEQDATRGTPANGTSSPRVTFKTLRTGVPKVSGASDRHHPAVQSFNDNEV